MSVNSTVQMHLDGHREVTMVTMSLTMTKSAKRVG